MVISRIIRSLCLALVLSGFNALHAQIENGKLVSGPMLGYVEHFEALIWLEVSKTAEKVAIKYYPESDKSAVQAVPYVGPLNRPFNPIKLTLNGLEMNTTYTYEVWIDGNKEVLPYPLQFTTRELWEWRKDAPDFSFIIGSCAYVNDPKYDRPGKPYGQDLAIFKAIENQPSDFMIWGGDNIYLREVDWSSKYGINYRYNQVRSQQVLQPLLASRSHFAIWDDHDYGPNNSDRSYELRNESLDLFKQYWGNKSFGEYDNPGVYGRFSWSDAEFFLIDDRFHRSNEDIDNQDPSKTYLGRKQLDWLKSALLSSNARFKFIVCGNQVLNPANRHESFRHYEKEYNELIGFIKESDVWGVVFLSGDRHFTEMNAIEDPEFYTLYDVTSSPLSSRPYSGIKESKEGQNNPARVEGTIVNQQNYVKISVLGDKKERHLLIQCFGIDNKELWRHKIRKNDLRPPKKEKN